MATRRIMLEELRDLEASKLHDELQTAWENVTRSIRLEVHFDPTTASYLQEIYYISSDDRKNDGAN